MALADRLATARPKRHGLPCPIETILASLDERDRDALIAALAMPIGHPERLGARSLTEELNAEGIKIHYASIDKHRRRQCRCYRGISS